MRWPPHVIALLLRADRATGSRRTCLAISGAKLIRIVTGSVVVTGARTRAIKPHSASRCHLIWIRLVLSRCLTSNSAHVLTAPSRDHRETATRQQSNRVFHRESLTCLRELASIGNDASRRSKVRREPTCLKNHGAVGFVHVRDDADCHLVRTQPLTNHLSTTHAFKFGESMQGRQPV